MTPWDSTPHRLDSTRCSAMESATCSLQPRPVRILDMTSKASAPSTESLTPSKSSFDAMAGQPIISSERSSISPRRFSTAGFVPS